MMKIEYSSNNSGGAWWLTDENWLALEAAGWKVEWVRDRTDGFFGCDRDGRWLGALAKEASKDFDSPAEAIREFERITGQNASDEGCNCCGAPHSFSWDAPDGEWGYASGEDVLPLLYSNPPKTLREAAERLNGGTA